MSTWGDYQMKYMNDRLGEGWGTNGAAITPDGYTEQTAFCSILYATVRWAIDKLCGKGTR